MMSKFEGTAQSGPNAAMPERVAQVLSDRARLSVLANLQTLQTLRDPDFDHLTNLAAALFGTPISLVSLLDSDRQLFKSSFGVSQTETAVNVSFCAHAIAADSDLTIVEDVSADPRFAENPFVTGEPNVRFYAGAPLVVYGARIGTLCVLDVKPRMSPDPVVLQQFQSLAALASNLFTLKDQSRRGRIAEAALVRSEKRHALALEAATIASWVWDIRSGMVECDPLLPQLFGLAPATRLRARQLFFAIDRRDLRSTDADLTRAVNASDEYNGAYRIRGISPVRWLATRGRVIERDDDGNALLVIGVSYDISERKWTEESQRGLLRELNHRVKNTLATVQALASQTVRHARDPREFLDAFRGRLVSLGRAHGLLSDLEWRGISLEELLRLQVLPFDDPNGPRIRTNGPKLWLTPDQALALSPILHEMGSNALQYGALSNGRGRVEIGWRVTGSAGSQEVLISWREIGGPPVAEPERKGFGSILIGRSLDKIMGSNVHHQFLPDGVEAEIRFPLETSAA
jgi:two-component sensor histidine kinase